MITKIIMKTIIIMKMIIMIVIIDDNWFISVISHICMYTFAQKYLRSHHRPWDAFRDIESTNLRCRGTLFVPRYVSRIYKMNMITCSAKLCMCHGASGQGFCNIFGAELFKAILYNILRLTRQCYHNLVSRTFSVAFGPININQSIL